MYEAILSTAVSVSLITVTITSYLLTNIFRTEQISAVKFPLDYEKTMSFFYIKIKRKNL